MPYPVPFFFRKKLLFLFFGLSTSPLFAQQSAEVFQPDSVKKIIQAAPITRSLRVDGRLDEAEWAQALPVTGFVQIEPYQRQAATHDTEVRLLYNRNFLYVAARLRDSEGRRALRVPNLKRDFQYGSSDVFGVSVDGFRDQRNAMMFAANPYGSQRDLLSFDDAIFDEDWDGLWRVRTTRSDSGWVVEMAIPWQTLRYQRRDTSRSGDQTWGINFFRLRRASNELTTWSAIPRAFSPLRMPYEGLLTGLQPPPPRANVRVQPYLLLSDDRYDGSEIGQRHTTALKAGGELKWAINPSTVLDLTVNTDFAQADADRQVNNLTRLSVFFPERRPFFLENAGLFGVGLASLNGGNWGGQMTVQPFFSRRIGLDAAGQPIPIEAGARLVYRSPERNAGVLYMRQRGATGLSATNYVVGRFSENFGKQNRLGGLLTLRNDATHTNLTGSVDGFFRLQPSLSLSTMLSVSGSSGNPVTARNEPGFFGFYQLLRKSNQWIW